MPSGGALVDTHAHFHDCFDPAAFLDAADANLGQAWRELEGAAPEVAPLARVLLVMETGDVELIDRLAEAAFGDWRGEPTAEAGALVMRRPDGAELILIEGRQLVTAENLEVLAAPCSADLEHGLSLASTLRSVASQDVVPILPWGFGKWTGRRGRLVSELLESSPPGRLLLADNGGRLALGWKPRLLTLGAQRGFPVVRGSDPLPRPREVGRVGSSGSLLRGAFDPGQPVASVRRLLAGLRESPRSFGRGVGPLDFVANQTWMQLRRRAG